MQLRTDQRFVGEHPAPLEVDDRLENHAEALVAKRLVEGPRGSRSGIGRVHENSLADAPLRTGPRGEQIASSAMNERPRAARFEAAAGLCGSGPLRKGRLGAR